MVNLSDYTCFLQPYRQIFQRSFKYIQYLNFDASKFEFLFAVNHGYVRYWRFARTLDVARNARVRVVEKNLT